MQLHDTSLFGVKLLSPRKFGDERGWFAEVFNSTSFKALGLPGAFVQDNQSRSARGVLRGLHYQLEQQQGKLIRVLSGEIFDVALDLRRESPTFGKHLGLNLKPMNEAGELTALWIPPGLAHGFLVLSEFAEVLYKTTDFYHPASERSILWNDPALAIEWPLHDLTPALSAKDAHGTPFHEAELPQSRVLV